MMDVRLQVFDMHRHLFQHKDVLDIGCNVGHITVAVARTLGARSVVGIDIDPVLIGKFKASIILILILTRTGPAWWVMSRSPCG
jgi:7SK snRNA methylphosphate capping enzyme